MTKVGRCALLGVLLVSALWGTSITAPSASATGVSEADDAVVIAVIDSAINPYHWDFLASKMPQALDKDPTNDLRLGVAPNEWLPGFPSPKAFDSYQPLKLNFEEKLAEAPIASLMALDKPKIDAVKESTADSLNYYWLPGTKVIGAMRFGPQPLVGPTSEHGVGVTSVSTGNLHGTCPECLLLFIGAGDAESSEAAIAWAMDQPWIDLISNSYGHGGVVPKFYNGTTVDEQRTASNRGQTVFFSAGNGVENAFTVVNPTYMSSQKGPDWLVTVGGVSPGDGNPYADATRASSEHASYVGAGKPADIAGVARAYSSAYTAIGVGQTGATGFGGTSNAAPTIAGLYARALYMARKDLPGPSRIQRAGVIAAGGRYSCASKRPKCELGDGRLTANELRRRLFHGAIHTPAGMTSYAHGAHTPPIGEDEFLNEGHGTYFARELRGDEWLKEFDRILGPMEGRLPTLERPPGEREWMIVDSFCRQSIWGAWKGGYYVEGKTALPGHESSYPVRSLLETTCPYLLPPPA